MDKRRRLAVGLTLVAGLGVGATSAAETGRGEGYVGWAYLFQVPDLTVVYPAGPGEDPAANRQSAELRAALLRTLHGTRTQVAADDEITAEQKQGNLLLIGWSNRLLGTEEAPRPFERTPWGLRFLGMTEHEEHLDLALFARSPYNPERFVFFWSRLDPELDRFLPLPAVGSDWAMYQRFRVVRQGMFRPGRQWPPARDEDAEADHGPEIDAIDLAWSRRRAARYDVFYEPATVSDAVLQEIVKAREAALDRASASLGALPKDYRVAFYVYKDTDRKKERTAVADAAHALPRERELHMSLEAATGGASHEEVHLVARQVLGPCYLTTLYEGLAIARDGVYENAGLDLHAALMVKRQQLPSLDALLDEAEALRLPQGQRAPAAGLLVRFIEAEGGADALRRAYGLRVGTVEGLARTLGRPAAEVEPAFRRFVEGRARTQRSEVAFLEVLGEAAAHHRAANYPGLAASLVRALEVKPDDRQTIFNLASARMRTREYDLAERDLRRLLALEQGNSGSMFAVFGHYQLGRLYDVQGRRQEALAEYRRVLELPDQKDAHRLAREAIETAVTPERLE